MDYTFSSIERIGNSPIDNFYIDNSANIYSLDGDHTVYSLSPRSSVVVRNFPQDISTKRKLTEMEDTKFKDFSSTYHNVLDSDNESYIDDDYVEWNIALSPTIGTEDLQFLIRNFERKEDNDISDREDQILCDSPNNYCILIDFEDSTNEVTKEEEESETVYNAKNDDSSNEIGYKSDDIHVNINNLRNLLEKAEKEKFELMKHILKLESKIKLLTLENEVLNDELNESVRIKSQP